MKISTAFTWTAALAGVLIAAYAVKFAGSQTVSVTGASANNGPGGIAAGAPLNSHPNYGFLSSSGSFISASMTPAPGRLIYMCGWSITGGGAAGRVGPIVVNGLGSEFDYDGSMTVDGGTVAYDKYLPYCLSAVNSSTTPSISVANVVGGAPIAIQMYGFDVPAN